MASIKLSLKIVVTIRTDIRTNRTKAQLMIKKGWAATKIPGDHVAEAKNVRAEKAADRDGIGSHKGQRKGVLEEEDQLIKITTT